MNLSSLITWVQELNTRYNALSVSGGTDQGIYQDAQRCWREGMAIADIQNALENLDQRLMALEDRPQKCCLIPEE